MDQILRLEVPADYRIVEELTRDAFWDHHVPGCDEHYLAHILRSSPDFIPELDFVALVKQADGSWQIAGNIMYTKAIIRTAKGEIDNIISFGPLSVAPGCQKRGLGAALVRHTINLASERGYEAILIYGDPLYYSRFGFIAAEQFGIRTKDAYFSPALQALELIQGSLSSAEGLFIESASYSLDSEAADLFDATFQAREKGFKPSQLRFQELLAQSHT
jgi:predicted N-acetyltransferase YhbS